MVDAEWPSKFPSTFNGIWSFPNFQNFCFLAPSTDNNLCELTMSEKHLQKATT